MAGPRVAGVVALSLAILLLGGCIKVPRETLDIKRYALDPQRGTTEERYPAQPLTIRVLPFGASASLRGDRILFRDQKHRLDPYFYHRWISPPAQLLEDLFSRAIESWEIARDGVIRNEIAVVPTHEIHGRLLDLYADNREDGPSARLEIELTLVRVDRKTLGKEIVFQETYGLEEDRQNGQVGSYVEATNRLVARWLEAVRANLVPVLVEEGRRIRG